MERPSQLERFLRKQKVDGQSQEAGHFTISREQAVRKLAEFQLPFAGAWVVKVIQSLVASGLRSAIQVEQSSKVTTIRIAEELPWSLAELEAALMDPQPHESRALNHMVAALRFVGMNKQRSFGICLMGAPDALVWDGNGLYKAESEPAADTLLTVMHSSPQTPTAWIVENMIAARSNSEVATALRDYCFTCPLPLYLDKRRVDGLQWCPRLGRGRHSFPLTLTFMPGDLPTQQWPPGTFEKRRVGGILSDGGGLEEFSEQLFCSIERPSPSGLAVMLTAHAEPQETNDQPLGHRVSEWKFTRESSRCYWILDGALIQNERLLVASGVSAALFLSADGLETDLSGFRLRNREMLRQRRRVACELAHDPIRALTSLSKTPLIERAAKRYRTASNVLVAGAMGVGGVMSTVGLAWVAIPLGGVAFLIRFAKHYGQNELLVDLGRNATDLGEKWPPLEPD